MARRALYIVLGLALIVLGFKGFFLAQQQMEKDNILKQLEIVKEQHEAQAKRAEEERKAQEQKVLAEKERKRAEIEKQKRLELEQKLAQEKFELQQKLAQQEKRDREQKEKQQKEEEERRIAAQKERERKARTTLIQFPLQASEASKARVAVVHLGDEITASVKRGARANETLYLGFGPLEEYSSLSVGRANSPGAGVANRPFTPWIPPWHLLAEGPLKFPNQPIYVHTPINDQVRKTVTLESTNDPQFVQCLQAREGVVLYVGTALGTAPGYISARPAGQGTYQVEVSIYRNNQWQIAARSLR